MRKGQDKKVNVAGQVSCLLLAMLLVAAVCPVAGSVYADEVSSDVQSGEVNYDDQIMTTAATASTVNIAFNPTAANGTVTPVDASGAKAKVDVTATVHVQNSGGYSVYVGSSSSQLKAGSNVIDSVASSTTYENMPLNRWGYSFAKGTTASNTYNAMPATLRGTALDSNTSTSIKNETRTYTLSFAANIGADKPAGTYTNQVTMSVVSSPLEITNAFGIDTMQEMTTAICSGVAAGTSDQLKDTRDGKYYWVTKLADGKCWMTQNLDLDLSTSKALTPADSDVSSNWTPGFNTATQANSGTVNSGSQTETRSWSLGNYRMKDSIAASGSDCGYPKNDASQCTGQFEAYTTPTSQNKDEKAHYILGNHYQWNAATAGTGGSMTSGEASSSICPKGWKLPTSNNTNVGSFGGLINAASIGSTVSKLTGSPNYFVRGGSVSQNTLGLFGYAGFSGSYWSSAPHSTATGAYLLYFRSASSITPSDTAIRNAGLSVRCLAR